MSSNSPNVKLSSTSMFDSSESDLDQSARYGGLVGDIWTGIEARMASGASAQAAPLADDSYGEFIRTLSVASGYIGLLLGFFAAVGCALLIF